MIRKGVKIAVATLATTTTAAVVGVLSRTERRSVTRSVTIYKPLSEVYAFLTDLPRLREAATGYADDVELVDDRTARWKDITAKMSTAEPDVLRWETSGGPAPIVCDVRLMPAPQDRGTEVHAIVEFDQVGGDLGTAVAKFAGIDPDLVLRTVLRQVKQVLECGEVPRVQGQPTGRGPVQERLTRLVQDRLAAGGRP